MITQLVGQVISLWQQIELSRQAVRTAPKALKDTKTRLSNLQDTVYEVENEPKLQKTAVRAQLEIIRDIILEFKEILATMVALQRRNPLRQSIYMLCHRPRDESLLCDILSRIYAAQIELAIRINVAHVEITREIAEGVGRIEREAREERIERQSAQDGHEEELRFKAIEQAVREEQTKWEVSKDRSEVRVRLLMEGNVSKDEASQSNGIYGFEDTQGSTSARIVENMATGKSIQTNFILGGPIPHQLLSGLFRP